MWNLTIRLELCHSQSALSCCCACDQAHCHATCRHIFLLKELHLTGHFTKYILIQILT
uniref:Uncharacterized protein n=1 Tax=Octopus bimaculoides TaxID=37653 RepID=A0A0L8HDQ1_OCTBM